LKESIPSRTLFVVLRKSVHTSVASHNFRLAMHHSYRFILSAALIGLLILGGCRTYGNEKYETGPKTYDALQQTVEQLEQELGHAKSDLQRLESAAQAREDLNSLAERYRSYVESHEAALEGYREQAEQLSPEASYRTLHRSYGAIVTDRRILQKQYQRTVRKVWATVRDTTLPRKAIRDPSRYVITPVNFPRTENEGAMTMADALEAMEGVPGLQREEQGDVLEQ
jgi:outer membrane murein-binding lipoprotein Lpp